MITPSWKTSQPLSPGPPSSIDILVGQGTVSPCDFADWANVLSNTEYANDGIRRCYVASFPNSAAAAAGPSIPNYVSMKGGLDGNGFYVT